MSNKKPLQIGDIVRIGEEGLYQVNPIGRIIALDLDVAWIRDITDRYVTRDTSTLVRA